MSRFMALALAGTTALGMSAGTVGTAEAAPLPALTGAQVGGTGTTVDNVGWRRGGYYGGYLGYGYRGYGYRRNAAGAAFAGAALGLIGGAIAASAAPRYGYGYGYGYPAYGGYSYPSYGYAPVGYGYGGYYGGGYGYPGYAW